MSRESGRCLRRRRARRERAVNVDASTARRESREKRKWIDRAEKRLLQRRCIESARESTSAAAPETCGVAIEVPLRNA